MGTNHLFTRKGSGHRPHAEPERFSDTLGRFNFTRIQFRVNRDASWMARIGLLSNIGWAIIAPALLGLSLGLWIDTMYPSHFSWISLLLPIGLFLGCVAAGYWFRQDFTPKD